MADNNHIRAFVERIERIEGEIKDMNADKADIYKEARSQGFDVKALKEVIRLRRKDPAERSELESLVETYMAALDAPVPARARARAHTREEVTANT